MISAIRALLQFTTVLPLGKTAPFIDFARNSWLYPLAGYVTGGIAAGVLYLLSALSLPPLIQAVIAVGVIILVSGANHLDGLFDLGDGLMAHGSREKRIHALTDRQIGTGGTALGLMVTLLAIVSLGSCTPGYIAASALILAETGAKWGMASLTILGKPFHEGLHESLHKEAKLWFFIPATLLILPACLLPLSPEALAGAACSVVAVPLVTCIVAQNLFGGVNGDVTGATGEISRAVILAVVVSIMA
ncbi:MAG: adenosylcobinamide-GDP ribazoletransferase [Methanospirillum sp.]|nr:adenosylcobinamide-GDP ribazoletransferase [Methanospirillum sp.]